MTLPVTRAQAQALVALQSRAPEVRVVVVGAAAVGHHVTLTRATADIDLAIAIAPSDLEALLGPLQWRRDERMRQRWYGPGGFRADVLPTTDELLRAGYVQLDDRSGTMSLVGFDLAFEHAERAPLPGLTAQVFVANLASLVVMKVVAWLERKQERRKDLGDLAAMLEQALAADADCRWDASDPVGAAQLTYDEQSPFFVGFSVATIARDVHRTCVQQFLAAMGDDHQAWPAVMAREAALTGDDPEGRAVAMLNAFVQGFRQGCDAMR